MKRQSIAAGLKVPYLVLIDATTATPDELAAHLGDAIEWTKANRDINPANAIIICAWNEHDEGGWLQHSLCWQKENRKNGPDRSNE